MLLYVGEGEQNLRPMLLATFVQSQITARRFAGRLTPKLELEGTPGLDRLLGNEDHLTQLLDQLLDNAQEASPGSGEHIRLRAGCRVFREEELAQAQIPIQPNPEGNPFLEVLDHGSGMTPEVLERAFDPFFTTRFTGRGLGLAAVAGIVRVHRGGLCCRSQEGSGTQLLVLFPRHPVGA
jgi:signal transduction histidine kinase